MVLNLCWKPGETGSDTSKRLDELAQADRRPASSSMSSVLGLSPVGVRSFSTIERVPHRSAAQLAFWLVPDPIKLTTESSLTICYMFDSSESLWSLGSHM